MQCGKPIENDEQEYCLDCEKYKRTFEKGFILMEYDDVTIPSLSAFKYHNAREYSEFYALEIRERLGEQLNSLGIEGLIPVPIHKRKRKTRGYNQAQVLTASLSKVLGIPQYPDYLTRQIDTTPQKELGPMARLKNLQKAFHIGENSVKLKKILLVDDIYTTGATMEACTGCLHEAGVQKVYCLSICSSRGY